MNGISIREKARETKVYDSADVVVAGGGIAGVAAALAAARSGSSVILVENTCTLGGLATVGNVTVYLPIDDGCGRVVMGGLARELLDLSIADLGAHVPAANFHDARPEWRDPRASRAERAEGQRFETGFNPCAFALSMEDLLVREGVRILYDTRVCDIVVKRGRITHLVVENKSGRTAIACRACVDATGDADICFLAGEPTVSNDSNVAGGWFYTVENGGALWVHTSSHAFSRNADKEGAEGPFFRGDDAWNVSRQILESRKLLRSELAGMRAAKPGADYQPINIPTIPTFRMTRRLAGAYELRDDDMHKWFDDAVCLACDWRRRGPVWAIPWRCIAATATANLTVCGRCASWHESSWDAMRVIPVCAATGEAAGIGASVAAGSRRGVSAIGGARIAREMSRRGNILDRAMLDPPVDGAR